MLTQLISLLGEKKDGLSLFEISRVMKAQPSTVLSILELLVQKGRLLELGPDEKYCADCGQVSDCNLLAVHGKRYVLAAIKPE
mgnify:CR=1 FL=1